MLSPTSLPIYQGHYHWKYHVVGTFLNCRVYGTFGAPQVPIFQHCCLSVYVISAATALVFLHPTQGPVVGPPAANTCSGVG